MRRQIDHGPVAAFAAPAVAGAIPNIGLTVGAARGAAWLAATVNVTNPAANTPTVTARILKNGALLGNASKSIIMVASERKQIIVHEIDPAPAVGDIYTVDLLTSSAVAGHEVPINGASLLFDAEANDRPFVSEVGLPTA